MSDELMYCKCGFKQVKSAFNKSDGACPVCGVAVLEGAEPKNREQLEEMRKNLPKRGQ